MSKDEASVTHGPMQPLTPHAKKFIGLLVILAWLLIYSLIAMRVAVDVLPHANWLTTLLYYAVTGTVWIVPIGLMLPWMHREPGKRQGKKIISGH